MCSGSTPTLTECVAYLDLQEHTDADYRRWFVDCCMALNQVLHEEMRNR